MFCWGRGWCLWKEIDEKGLVVKKEGDGCVRRFDSAGRILRREKGSFGRRPAGLTGLCLNTRSVKVPGNGSGRDRKSTRLNSSHVKISYAVFCLKKKKVLSN